MQRCSNNQKMHHLWISRQDPTSCTFLCHSCSFQQPNHLESNSNQGREIIRRLGRERKSVRKN